MAAFNRYDLFYGLNVGEGSNYVEQNSTGVAISGDTVLSAEGTEFTLSSTRQWTEGQLVYIEDTATTPNTRAYCICIGTRAVSTKVSLLPLQSAADTGDPIEHTFAAATTTILADITTPAIAQKLIIDLSEAPDDVYDYIIIGTANLSAQTAGTAVGCWIRQIAFGDPASGTDYARAHVTLPSATYADRYHYFGALHVTLQGGQRHEFQQHLAGALFRFRAYEPKMLAFRFDASQAYIDGDGKTAETTATSGGGNVDHVALQTDIPSDDYLVIMSAMCSADDATATGAGRMRIELRESNSSNLAVLYGTPRDVSDYYSAGSFDVYDPGASNVFRITIEDQALATQKVRHGLCAAIPLSAVYAADIVTSEEEDNKAINLVGTDWESEVANAQTLTSGDYIEIVKFNTQNTDPDTTTIADVRPVYGGANDGEYSHFDLNSDETKDLPLVFMRRSAALSGARTNEIEYREPTGVTDAEDRHECRVIRFAYLRETAVLNEQPATEVSVVAEVQTGLALKFGWTNVTGDRYSQVLSGYDPEVRLVRRFLEGKPSESGREFAEVSGTTPAAQEWAWDIATQTLYATFRSSDVPSDNDRFPIAVPVLLVGRDYETLTVERRPQGSEVWPFEPRLIELPSLDISLDASGGEISIASSLGRIALALDGRDLLSFLSIRELSGFSCTVWRGSSALSSELVDFEKIICAIQDTPEVDGDSLIIPLFDRVAEFNVEVDVTRITAYTGGSQNLVSENQPLKVAYGEVLRVVAHRDQQNTGTGTWNTYAFCPHAVSEILSVRLESEGYETLALTTEYDDAATYIDAGKVRVKCDAFPDPNEPGDIVYVDFVGRTADVGDSTAAALVKPGEIPADMIETYGAGVSGDRIVSTFEAFDHFAPDLLPKRPQWKDGIAWREPVRTGILIEDGMSVADALSAYLSSIGAYLYTYAGRIGINTPDHDGDLLLPNYGLESWGTFTTQHWPFAEEDGAQVRYTTDEAYIGSYSLRIDNNQNDFGRGGAAVDIPSDGFYVLTCMALSGQGVATKCRASLVEPSADEHITDDLTISTTEWTRLSLFATVGRAGVGYGRARLYPAYNDTSSPDSIVYFDDIRFARVYAILDETNCEVVGSIVQEPDVFHSIGCPIEVNTSAPEGISAQRIVIPDSEARGLGISQTPEGRAAVPSSGRYDQPVTALHKNGRSGAGVGASIGRYYGRPRLRAPVVHMGFARLPRIGEWIAVRDVPNLPPAHDGNPMWRIVGLDYDPDNAKQIGLMIERQKDPIADRCKRV